MYRSHYKLTERPFEISTDTRFLWMGEKHQEALAMLKYGVLARKGFLLLTGDVGTGKTTLVNALLESLSDSTLVANITDPLLEPLDFFNFIAASFNMGQRFDNKVDFILRFGEFLRRENADGKNVLLILDEAHRFSKDLLEQFRLLSNIELPEKKLINMFLVGQNEFNRTLMSTDCRALRQRITLTYSIKPLSEEETLEYIRYRLKVAGSEAEIFNRKAVGEVYRFSQGYPRLINIICDHALLTGFVKQLRNITPAMIRECAQELCLMGDTVHISASDFFEGAQTRPAASPLPASPAAAGDPTPKPSPPPNTAPPARRPTEAVQLEIPSAASGDMRAAHGSWRETEGPKRSGSRYWGIASLALIIAIAIASSLMLRKDFLPGSGKGDRTASAGAVPSPVPGEADRSQPPPPGPETITLHPTEPLASVKPDGGLAVAKPTPYEKARTEIDKGNVARAVELLEDAIKKAPPGDLPRLRTLYSDALRRQAGLLSDRSGPKAERLLTKAVAADPKNGKAYFDLGKIRMKAKDQLYYLMKETKGG